VRTVDATRVGSGPQIASLASIPLAPLTVEFHSIRISRVTGPKIYEYFRTCHRSPRGYSNVPKMSQNREKCLKNPIFARTARFACSGGNENFSGACRTLRTSGRTPVAARAAGIVQKTDFDNPVVDLDVVLA
jgi:hypothetical protein